MTPVFLLEELQKFISSKTSDIILPVRTRTGQKQISSGQSGKQRRKRKSSSSL